MKMVYGQEDIARRLEEGLNTDDPVDFEDLLRTKPDYVIGYLADKGTSKLGSFVTEVRTIAAPAGCGVERPHIAHQTMHVIGLACAAQTDCFWQRGDQRWQTMTW